MLPQPLLPPTPSDAQELKKRVNQAITEYRKLYRLPEGGGQRASRWWEACALRSGQRAACAAGRGQRAQRAVGRVRSGWRAQRAASSVRNVRSGRRAGALAAAASDSALQCRRRTERYSCDGQSAAATAHIMLAAAVAYSALHLRRTE